MTKLCTSCEKLMNDFKKEKQTKNERLENYPLNEAVEKFLSKNYTGGSKADREDYTIMVSAKDIYDLREAFIAQKNKNN